MTRVYVATVAILVAGSVPAAGQSATPLSLEDAVTRAVAQAPRVAEARSKQEAATSTIAARTALNSPTVTTTSGYLRTNHVDEFGVPQQDGSFRVLFPDIPVNYRARAEVDLPIYTGGRVTAAVDAARADLRAAEADAKSVEQDVRLDVTRAYWALVTARETVKVLEVGLQRMNAWVGDVQARVTAGVLPPNDLLSAQAQRARQNVQLIQAKNSAALAEIDLSRLAGLALGTPIQPTTPVDRPLPGAADAAGQALEALVTRAKEGRSERAAIQDRQAGLRSAAEVSLAATRPQLAAMAAIEPARPNSRFVPRTDDWNTSWDVGLNFTWPLFDGGRARAEHAASLAQASALGHRLEDVDALIAVEIRQRLLDLESSRAALDAAGEGVTAAAEARRVLGERFTAGVATPTDVLDAQNALLQAELDRTQIAASLRLGEARLLRAIGGL